MPPGPQETQVPQVTLMPQDPFIKGDITNVDLMDALMNLTQHMTVQAHVVNNHFVAQENQGDRPNLMLVLSPLEFGIS